MVMLCATVAMQHKQRVFLVTAVYLRQWRGLKTAKQHLLLLFPPPGASSFAVGSDLRFPSSGWQSLISSHFRWPPVESDELFEGDFITPEAFQAGLSDLGPH